MEEIIFDKEARNKLILGVNKMAKAVGSTLGPKGNTVIIPDKNNYGKYIITKDGVSVAREIFFKDPIENIGAQLLKEVAELTVKQAGDGTTTATVLAAALVTNLQEFNYVDINKALNEIIPKVLEQLKVNSKELKHEDIKHVASISANNDLQIGELIQQAYNFSKLVKVEQTNNIKDKLELIDGMSLLTSYLSKHFITDISKGICELNEPKVIIIDGHLDDLLPFKNILENVSVNNNSILIIADHVHENVLRLLESNVLSGSLKLCVMKSPGFSTHRKNLLDDISKFTGASVIKDVKKPFTVGKLKSCKITNNLSILLKDELIVIDEYVNNLKEFSKLDTVEEYDKELLQQRIENLESKIAVIKVGGQSEIEVKERYDRYDDAIRAVSCALEEGIVEGGGVALYKVNLNITNKINSTLIENILASISKPYCIIFPKLNLEINENKQIISYDLKVNMFDQNIIDPLKVTRCALENAVSIARTILSTNAVVLNSNQWKD